MDTKLNNTIKMISEAYENIISEGKESKFKAGDKVGIVSGLSHTHLVDTGTVSKVNGHGHHTVTYDNRKSMDNPSEQYTEVFDHSGASRNPHSYSRLIAHDVFMKTKNDNEARATRNRDFSQILEHIAGHRTGAGHYVPFDSTTAAAIKELIDKHTEQK